MMKDLKLACFLVVVVLVQKSCVARDFSSAAAQASSQPARRGSDASVHRATNGAPQRPAQGSVQAAEHVQPDRRLLGRSGPTKGPAELAELNLEVPEVNANKFKKIALTNSRPLGTGVDGAPWAPGACGPHPSALGYQCSWVGAEGAVLHWSYSTHSSAPPINRCTKQPQAVPNLEIQELDGPTIHFALQAVTKEKLHLAFMDPEARLYPSEGVHGRAVDPCNKPATCNTTSTPEVEILHHTSPGVFYSTGRVSSWNPDLMQGWAGWASADTEGQTQVLCVSRHVYTKQMKMGPQNKMELLIQYATSDAPNYMGSGHLRGSVALDVLTGKATEIPKPTGVLLAHAILMLIAFGVLLPTGLLLARHKWLFFDEEEGLSPLWALSHFGILLLCAMVALAGMIVALVRFGNTVTGLVMSTHQVLGLLSVGLSVALAIMYGLRPFLVSSQKHKHMPSPLLGPQKVIGVITIATGWASLFLGCVVIHQNWAAAYLTWLTPCVLMTALVACAATLLELRYQKLVRTGAYNPKTCTMSNKGPAMPLARIRTHREPTMPKKQEPDVVGDAHRDSPTIAAIHMRGSNDGSPAATVAATMLARSNGMEMAGQLPVSTDSSTPRSCLSSSAGGRGSSAGGAVRRTRHNTPNAAAAAVHVVQTGFPSSSRPHMGPADAA